MKSVILCKSVRNVCLNPGVQGGGCKVLEPGGFSRGVEKVKVSKRDAGELIQYHTANS